MTGFFGWLFGWGAKNGATTPASQAPRPAATPAKPAAATQPQPAPAKPAPGPAPLLPTLAPKPKPPDGAPPSVPVATAPKPASPAPAPAAPRPTASSPVPPAAAAAAAAAPSKSNVLEKKSVEPIKPFPTKLPDAELVVIQMFGGDNNLSQFVYEDLQEMAAGIGTAKIAVLGITDLANKPGAIVEVTPANGIQILESMGEIDTGDPEVLHAFLVRALVTHPKARKAIGFWDHGTGVFDETDSSEKIMTRRINSVTRENRSRSRPARRLFFPKNRIEEDTDTRAMLHDDTNGGVLTNLEAGAMLRAAFKDAGIEGKVDLLFSDTCLNGMIEVLDELGGTAKVIVASQDLEPGDGWDYKRWLGRVAQAPPATAEDWGKYAVDAFKEAYEPFPKKWPCTLGAFRSEHGMTKAFAEMIAACRKANGFAAFVYLDHARAQTQGFAQRDTYDVRDFAEKVAAIAQQGMPEVAAAATNLVKAYDAARIHSINLGKFVPRSTGLSFYFPASRSQMMRDIGTYEKLAFAKNSGWAEFLKEFR